jgi:hypothetical protein
VSYGLTVFCRRPAEHLTRQEIAQAVVDGVYFEDTPEFDPPLHSAEARAPEWDTLVIRYAAAKRPVVVFRRGALRGIEEDIEEAFVKPPLDPAMKRRLVEAKQTFTLDVDQEGLTDEAWEMCDFIEHFIADQCDGLIWAPGDGIFDAKLQPIAKATAK